MKDESSQRESDPRRLQRAQYQSNWKRITALASHSQVSNVSTGGKVFGIFHPRNIRGAPFIFEATFETRARHYAERGFRIINVCSALLFLLRDDSRWYFNQTAFHRFSIPRKRNDFKGPGSKPRYAGENRIGEETRNLRSTLSDRNGLAEKSNSTVLEIKGARPRETRNLISLFLAALARKCAALTTRALNFKPSLEMSSKRLFHSFQLQLQNVKQIRFLI